MQTSANPAGKTVLQAYHCHLGPATAAPQGSVITEVPLDSVETTSILPVAGGAAAAVTETPSAATTAPSMEGATVAAPRRPTKNTSQPNSDVQNPFIQVGTFASSANASGLTKILQNNGVNAIVRELSASNGTTLYRVLAGPASSQVELTEISERVSSLGFTDAFPVEK